MLCSEKLSCCSFGLHCLHLSLPKGARHTIWNPKPSPHPLLQSVVLMLCPPIHCPDSVNFRDSPKIWGGSALFVQKGGVFQWFAAVEGCRLQMVNRRRLGWSNLPPPLPSRLLAVLHSCALASLLHVLRVLFPSQSPAPSLLLSFSPSLLLSFSPSLLLSFSPSLLLSCDR